MFDRLTSSFQGLYRKLSGQATISESNVAEAMEDVRTALLEADVHLDVVNKFCDEVVQEAVGREVTKSLRPGQEMIGIVHDKLVELLGGTAEDAALGVATLKAVSGQMTPEEAGRATAIPKAEPPIMHMSPGPTIVMMCGLQGSGKTTTVGKLAAYLKKRGRSVMVAAADLQRPAAVDQLATIAKQV